MNKNTYSAKDLETISRLTKRQAVAFIQTYGNATKPRHKYIGVQRFHALYSMGYVDAFMKGWKNDDNRVQHGGTENEQHEDDNKGVLR